MKTFFKILISIQDVFTLNYNTFPKLWFTSSQQYDYDIFISCSTLYLTNLHNSP